MTTSAAFGASQHAVIIGIDGLSIRALHEALDAGLAPSLKALRSAGAVTDDARCTQPSISLPNWASTLFSAPPEMHGVHGTTYDHTVRPAALEDDQIWPNLFTVARAAKPALTTAAFYSWAPLGLLMPRHSLNATVLRPCRSCDECLEIEPKLADDYLTALRTRRFGLSWLYLDVLDECGHGRGDRSKSYGALVQMVDAMVGKVVATLREAGMLDQTTLLVMSDHGRETRGFAHGGFTTEELSVQWLLSGPGVRKGATITGPVSIMDGAPTLLHALGVTPPLQMRGRVVREAYEAAREGPPGGPAGDQNPRPWSVNERSATATSMRELVDREMPPPLKGPIRLFMSRLLHGWDGPSVQFGALLGVLGVLAAYLGVSRYLEGARQAQSRNRFGSATLLGQGHELNSMRRHPAAHRLRAAAGGGAGGHGAEEEEECGLLS